MMMGTALRAFAHPTDFLQRLGEDYMVHPDWLSRSVRQTERATLPLTNLYIANCEGVRKAAIETLNIPPEKIITILNATDVSRLRKDLYERRQVRQQLGLTDDQFVIGSVGSLTQRKNHILLIEQLPQLLQHTKNAKVLLIGDGEEKNRLLEAVRERHLENHVLFLGFRHDAVQLMKAMDVLVMPSLREGLPRAAIEAQALGIPAVLSRTGGNAEVVADGQTGFVFDLSRPQDLIDAVSTLFHNRALRERMAHHAERRAKCLFTAERLAAESEKVYDKLLQSIPRRRLSKAAIWQK